MITTSRTLGDRLVFPDSATWNSSSFAVTSGCSRNALNGPIRRPSPGHRPDAQLVGEHHPRADQLVVELALGGGHRRRVGQRQPSAERTGGLIHRGSPFTLRTRRRYWPSRGIGCHRCPVTKASPDYGQDRVL